MAEIAGTAVLLVENEAIVRQWLRQALSGTEFRIVGEARNAAETFALLEHRAPSLILIDCSLPDANGIAVARELRRRCAATPAILMAANERMDSTKQRARPVFGAR